MSIFGYNEIMIMFKKILKTILMLTLLAGIMSLLRFFISGYSSYLWLNWNLVLALVPLPLAVFAIRTKKHWLAFVWIVLWLGFLPNAPYLVTDFIHLADVGPKSLLWYDALMIFVYSFVGVGSWIMSLHILRTHFKWKVWVVWLIAFLTGFGIYLGRYIRFNTWNLITHPGDVLGKIGDVIIHPFNHEPAIMMTLTFSIVLSIIYLSITPLISHEKTSH